MIKNKTIKILFTFIVTILLVCTCFCVGCSRNKPPHEHTWVEATCTTARKCSGCQEEMGEPLGHLVRVGECPRCGELSLDLITNVRQITESIENITASLLSCVEKLSTSYEFITDEYQQKYVLKAEIEFLYLRIYIQDGIDACANYVEFSEVKAHLISMQELFNSKCLQTDGIYMLGTYETIRTDLISLCSEMSDTTSDIVSYLENWLED